METVNAVLYTVPLRVAIGGSFKNSQRSRVSVRQIRPRPKRAMKLMASGVTCSAASTRSPSFSRSSSSTRMTMRPAAISATMSSTGEMGTGIRGVFMKRGAFVGTVFRSCLARHSNAGSCGRGACCAAIAPPTAQRTCDAALPHVKGARRWRTLPLKGVILVHPGQALRAAVGLRIAVPQMAEPCSTTSVVG